MGKSNPQNGLEQVILKAETEVGIIIKFINFKLSNFHIVEVRLEDRVLIRLFRMLSY